MAKQVRIAVYTENEDAFGAIMRYGDYLITVPQDTPLDDIKNALSKAQDEVEYYSMDNVFEMACNDNGWTCTYAKDIQEPDWKYNFDDDCEFI